MKPADHPLVTVLPETVRVDLVAQVRRVSHPARAVILAEGTLSTDFFLILEGTVEIVRGGVPIGARAPRREPRHNRSAGLVPSAIGGTFDRLCR